MTKFTEPGHTRAAARRGLGRGRRMLACHHEAGHALARWYFGHYLDRVVVLTVEEVLQGVKVVTDRGREMQVEGAALGYGIAPSLSREELVELCAKEADRRGPERAARVWRSAIVDVETDLILAAAGPVAEAVYTKRNTVLCMLWGGDGDVADMHRLTHEWFDTEAERDKAFEDAFARASALVRSPPGRRAITALAGRLKDTGLVDCEEAERIFEAAYGRKMVRFGAWSEHWPPALGQLRQGWLPE